MVTALRLVSTARVAVEAPRLEAGAEIEGGAAGFEAPSIRLREPEAATRPARRDGRLLLRRPAEEKSFLVHCAEEEGPSSARRPRRRTSSSARQPRMMVHPPPPRRGCSLPRPLR